ncbi:MULTISPECIES: glycosyltransferase family 2 protein [unclassified Tatumella]|uniref:glycosyltransferase family 2 protein n=1 Tax=unclassified Tatumella TaxID=2649542 RepID=UPI001BAE5CAE|nr:MULTISPECIES: glycosyltransferase family 2 protein [unclassified Tatumella]MBS0876916.1 glycosyltransferase family 2 protein [Tatumella sp. JGM82]MBS0891946.1 glycosyltransferase family 2 protein [Tatumella sp. JGM94]MBS0900544.1 glycosyltransferase family 2 protein [Tatumella sp. JGM100]
MKLNHSNSKVGIIMPMYNAEATIERAIESVINQKYKEWILYIIDDCSTDNSHVLIEKYLSDDRIVLLKNDCNIGAAKTRNNGLIASNEEFICFLDSDDEWLPEKLFIQKNEIGTNDFFSITNYNYISQGNSFPIIANKLFLNKHDLLSKKYRVCFSSLMIKRKDKEMVFENIGHEDFLFLLGCLKENRVIKIVNKPLVNYHAQPVSLSSNKKKAIIWHYKILKNLYPFNLIKRCYYMLCYAYQGVMFSKKIR